jgi:hypothetical protein
MRTELGEHFIFPKTKVVQSAHFILTETISRVVYTQKSAFEGSTFGAFLFGNAPEVVWVPLTDSIREWLGCTGKLQVRCWAQLNASRTTLVIATLENYNAVRAAGGS